MKRTWAFVAILLSALLLTGCGLLSASLFPAYLSLAVDAVSVAEFIGDPLTTETNLSVLNNGAGDMLFLVVRRPGQPETLVLIAGEPLEVLGSVTQDELNLVTGLLPPDQGYFGRLRMVDASLNFVVGNFMFSPDFGTTTENFYSLNKLPVWASANDVGFSIFAGNPAGWAAGNYVLRAFDRYLQVAYREGANWGGASADYDIQHELTLSPIGDLRVQGAFYDSDSNALLLSLAMDDRLRVYFIPPTGPPPADFFAMPLIPDIINVYPYREYRDVARDSFHLTVDGIVIRTHEGFWERYKEDKSPIDRLRAPSNDEYFDEAFSPSGEYYYLIDEREERLYKLRTWW